MNIVTGLHKEDKQRIKQLLYHHLPDLYFTPRGELSDDEGDNDEGTAKLLESVTESMVYCSYMV